MYQSGRDDSWSGLDDTNRKDWSIARQWIHERHPSGNVLDVGCFRGDFLLSLGNSYSISGIELHPTAAKHAADSGVAIVGTDFDALDALEPVYDWVVAFDVIEHAEDPKKLLEQLIRLCKPGGRVIVSSGNLNALSWRLMGSRYWYCAIPEHLSFINPDWCRQVASECFSHVAELFKFSHEPASVWKKISQLLKSVLYRVAPSVASWARRTGFGKEDVGMHPELQHSPPKWLTARDHLIALFEKSPR